MFYACHPWPWLGRRFMDVVVFAHKPRLLDVAEAQCTRSLGLGYKMCAVIPVTGQRTHGTTFRALKVTSQVAVPGAESAVCDCLDLCLLFVLYLHLCSAAVTHLCSAAVTGARI